MKFSINSIDLYDGSMGHGYPCDRLGFIDHFTHVSSPLAYCRLWLRHQRLSVECAGGGVYGCVVAGAGLWWLSTSVVSGDRLPVLQL